MKTICKYKNACKFAITTVAIIFLVACKDDKSNDDINDKPTILTSPKYIKSEISLAESTVIKVEAKESGIQDEDGVANLVYKMVGSPRNCDTTGGRVIYIEKEYIANNGVFEIEVPKGCGYKYYFFAEADVVVKWCRSDSVDASGKSVPNNGQSVVTKRSYVIEMTNQKDEVLKSDPFSIGINVPPRGC
jgi:hypothetical protein